MDNFKSMQDAWKNQSAANLPEIESIKKGIQKMRNQLIRRNAMGIAALTFTIGVMLWLLFGIDFEFITTKVALVGIILTLIGAIAFFMSLINRLYKADQLKYSSKEYLQHLKQFKMKQGSWQQKGVVAYFVLIIGFVYLYFYEVYHMDKWIGITAYVSSTLWMLYVWFVMRPRIEEKIATEINEMIAEVERIESQLGGDKV